MREIFKIIKLGYIIEIGIHILIFNEKLHKLIKNCHFISEVLQLFLTNNARYIIYIKLYINYNILLIINIIYYCY